MITITSRLDAWKPSVFNVFIYQGGRCYCLNSTSGKAFSFEPNEYNLLQNCLEEISRKGHCSVTAINDFLVRSSFVVPRDIDEHEREHQRFMQMKTSKDWAFLCIVPTFKCNLRCSYCFQRNARPLSSMSNSICEGLVAMFFDLARRVNGISVIWFGGEPLLALRTIDWLSAQFKHICHTLGVGYHAEMITNGSLLNRDSVRRLKDLSLSRMEISIDGSPESYSKRKGLRLNRAIAFYDFLSYNADALIECVNSLVLRINVDRENIEEAWEIVRRLKQQCNVAHKIDFRLQVLSTGKGLVECIPQKCFSRHEAAKVQSDFTRFLSDEGLLVRGLFVPLNHPCMAVRHYAYTIDPDGQIGKCVPATGRPDATFFRMDPLDSSRTLEKLTSIEQPYADFDPFVDKTCGQCPFLPVCLGQCPRDHESGNFVCTRRREFEAKLALCDETVPVFQLHSHGC